MRLQNGYRCVHSKNWLSPVKTFFVVVRFTTVIFPAVSGQRWLIVNENAVIMQTTLTAYLSIVDTNTRKKQLPPASNVNVASSPLNGARLFSEIRQFFPLTSLLYVVLSYNSAPLCVILATIKLTFRIAKKKQFVLLASS